VKQALAAAFCVAILGFAGCAGAADLPARGPVVPIPVQSAPNWSGFYAGVNAGYGFGKTTNQAGTSNDKLEGVLGGGQVGGQWQTGMFVFGFEGDIQISLQQQDFIATIAGTAVSVKEETPWFGTARLRAGFAFDRVLVYATGGGAYVNLKVSGAAGGPVLADKVTHAAWTAGGGFEVLLSERWSGKVEYLYLDTGNVTLAPGGTTVTGTLRDQIVRTGLNYHF
jgi:outer membrane immunogenic protein